MRTQAIMVWKWKRTPLRTIMNKVCSLVSETTRERSIVREKNGIKKARPALHVLNWNSAGLRQRSANNQRRGRESSVVLYNANYKTLNRTVH